MFGISYSQSISATEQSPCNLHPTHPGWRVYINQKYRFCFEYPPSYKPVRAVIDGWTYPAQCLDRLQDTSPNAKSDLFDEDTTIDIIHYSWPFRREGLTRFAPTGMQDLPPDPISTKFQTFYYDGPGGGGVAYPDVFYFGLQRQTFSIQFSGPYFDSKSPAQVTKEIEPKVLASFRQF
jgi:hypothetical protein